MLIDKKLLIVTWAFLLVGMTVKFTFPQIDKGLNIDLILAGTGGFGLIVTMHFIGYIEGYEKGFANGKTTGH